jgi:hypothetical protein
MVVSAASGVREQPATCRVGEHVRGDRFGASGGAFGRRAVEGGQQRPEPAVRRDGDRFAASHVLHRRGKVGERPLAILGEQCEQCRALAPQVRLELCAGGQCAGVRGGLLARGPVAGEGVGLGHAHPREPGLPGQSEPCRGVHAAAPGRQRRCGLEPYPVDRGQVQVDRGDQPGGAGLDGGVAGPV